MKLKPYPAYKDSGVEWLGAIPQDWKKIPVKQLGRLKGGAGFPHEDQGIGSEEFDFHKVNALGSALSDGLLQPSENTISKETAQRLGAFIFPKNTIVFAKVGAALLLGRIRELSSKACLDNNMMGLVINQNLHNVKFARYAMSLIRFDLISNPGAVPSVNESQIGNFALSAPNKYEQNIIVTFLDRETRKLDTLIAKQEHIIELLQEKRQAIISHAVTKGLDSDVKMKESGVEWLGMVPENWKVRRLKYNLKLLNDKTERSNFSVGLENIESWSGKFIKTETEFEGEGIAFNIGDILFGKLRPYLAKVYLAEFSGEAVGDFHVLRPKENVEARFAQYQMLNRDFISIVDGSTYGAKMPRASWDFVGGMMVTAPPVTEQNLISDYLDVQTTTIDTLIGKAQRSIELAKEHRTALISAAVTGKIDVRDCVNDLEAA